MDVQDWRSVSVHYVRDCITKAVTPSMLEFAPDSLLAVGDDGKEVAMFLRDELRVRNSAKPPAPILSISPVTGTLQLFVESPYNPRDVPYEGSLSGLRLLVVDKVDNTRQAIVSYLSQLQVLIDAQQQAHVQAGQPWVAPQVGVFVLHNKRRPKAADLPAEVMAGRYFVGEESDNVQIAYPFNLTSMPVQQPSIAHAHPSGSSHSAHRGEVMRRHLPAPQAGAAMPSGCIRSMSSHYVESILEKAVEEQQLVQRFQPTMLVAASDGALAPARMLRNYLRHRAGRTVPDQPIATPAPTPDLPILTPRLELYDEETNPYLAHITGVRLWGPQSLAGQKVLVVDKADSTRSTLAAFVKQLGDAAAAAKAEAVEAGHPWLEGTDPQFGVFVLHNKKVEKMADLPGNILADRYFCCEEADNANIAYPFAT